MVALIVFGSIFTLWLVFYFIPVGLWFNALVSGVKIPLIQLVLMRWRKVP
ncbi:MAG: flotillin-like FloA family protein, partial [Bacteroidales bacterium]|nr:flotillin-like FloA family protein [Bacteroidales bacterium]